MFSYVFLRAHFTNSVTAALSSLDSKMRMLQTIWWYETTEIGIEHS